MFGIFKLATMLKNFYSEENFTQFSMIGYNFVAFLKYNFFLIEKSICEKGSNSFPEGSLV